MRIIGMLAHLQGRFAQLIALENSVHRGIVILIGL